MKLQKKNINLLFIPTYNERENIEILLNQILDLKYSFDILIIDDSSPDKTYDFLKKKYNHLNYFNIKKRNKKSGVGSAHIDAIKIAYSSGYEKLITMDADLTHKPSDIKFLLNKSYECDIVLGSRFYLKDSLEDWNFFRKSITNMGHILTKYLLGIPYDATGAFRLYNLINIKENDFNHIKSNHYDFFYESLVLLHQKKYSIKEVPIKLPSRTYGNSKMSFIQLLNSFFKIFYLSIKTKIKKPR